MVITNLTFATIISIIFMIGLLIIYFSKKRADNEENEIYKILISANVLGLVLHLVCDMISYNYEFLPTWYSTIFFKTYLVYYVSFGVLLLTYQCVISKTLNMSLKTCEKFATLIMLIATAIIIILPQDLYADRVNFIFYTQGLDVKFTYAFSSIVITLLILNLIISFKKVSKKKTIPLYLFVAGCTVSVIIQNINPMWVITDCVEAIICFMMYFTIENPDMKLIEQLNIARDQAEKANNAKTDFLSNMSHEIRTPLNAIVGFSQAILEEDNVPDNIKDEVNDIVMASDGLLEIVNGILDISKIEANKLEIINTEYEINKILNDLTVLTKSRIGEKSIELKCNFDGSIPEVLYGDHTRLKQIILNLLTNAAKYTKEGTIEFNVSSVIKDDICRLIISVEDTGIGIQEDKIEHLFEKFDRLGVEENITIEGTGLGLAITKKLVDLMGGKIVVQSVFGKGSKFTVAIDQRVVALKAPEEKKEEKVETLVFEGKKILVVDDNKVNLKVATRLLTNYKVDIETIDNGPDTIEKIKNNESFDLILMDDMMPKMSGTETLHELQKIEGFNIPVIALTANAISGMKEKYLSEGFNDYLSKPIERNELNRVLKKYLS